MRPIVAVLPLLCSVDAVARPALRMRLERDDSLREPQATGWTGSARLQVDRFDRPACRHLRWHD